MLRTKYANKHTSQGTKTTYGRYKVIKLFMYLWDVLSVKIYNNLNKVIRNVTKQFNFAKICICVPH